jgi:hypothetical protein
MQPLTEAHLMLANQPQQLLRAYRVSTAVVVDMINEANEQISQSMQGFLSESSLKCRHFCNTPLSDR